MKLRTILLSLIFVLLITPNFLGCISGSKIQLDPSVGQDWKVITFGEIKYKWRVEIEAENLHDLCNVTVTVGGYGGYYYDSVEEAWNFNSSILFLKPGESDQLFLTWEDTTALELGAVSFESTLNKAAFTDQQTNVLVDYEIRIYDDRGNLISDSEDPDLNDRIQDDPGGDVPPPCLDMWIVITIPFGFLIIAGRRRIKRTRKFDKGSN